MGKGAQSDYSHASFTYTGAPVAEKAATSAALDKNEDKDEDKDEDKGKGKGGQGRESELMQASLAATSLTAEKVPAPP